MKPCSSVDPDLFFDESRYGLPIFLCGMCDHAPECTLKGDREEFGVWGGLTPEMRGYGNVDKVAAQVAEATMIHGHIVDGTNVSSSARAFGRPQRTTSEILSHARKQIGFLDGMRFASR